MLYPLRYVQPSDWGLAHISEWMSPNFHLVTFIPLLILIMLVLLEDVRGVPGWLSTLSLLGVVAALLAQRNAPVAAVLCLPAVVLGLGGVRLRPPRTPGGPGSTPHGAVAGDRRGDRGGRPGSAGSHCFGGRPTFPVAAFDHLAASPQPPVS